MLQVQIIKTTDNQFLGNVVTIQGVDALGVLTLLQIQEIAKHINPQFVPTAVIRLPDSTRLVSSNYSIELKKINA